MVNLVSGCVHLFNVVSFVVFIWYIMGLYQAISFIINCVTVKCKDNFLLQICITNLSFSQ